jgi:hypothetical protein
MFRRDRSGRAAVDSLAGGLGPPNAALAAAEGPQVRKAAAPWRCARDPQFGHDGRTMLWSPTGRFNSCNANMGPLAMHFKRTNEIQTYV